MRQRITCAACGKVLRPKIEAHPSLVYHRCTGVHRLGSIRPARRIPSRQEARGAMWDALLDAAGPGALLRPIDESDEGDE